MIPVAFLSAALSLLATFAQAAELPQEKKGVWLDVPFIKQTEDGCGSAAIAMLLQYWGAHGVEVAPGRADANTIQKELYSHKAHGIFAADMERYVRDSGFREFAVRGDWDDLRQHLQQGRPLIVSIQPGKPTRFHYVVVTGMDFQDEAVFVHDPSRGKLLRIERQEFTKQWSAVGNWMLFAVPARSH